MGLNELCKTTIRWSTNISFSVVAGPHRSIMALAVSQLPWNSLKGNKVSSPQECKKLHHFRSFGTLCPFLTLLYFSFPFHLFLF